MQRRDEARCVLSEDHRSWNAIQNQLVKTWAQGVWLGDFHYTVVCGIRVIVLADILVDERKGIMATLLSLILLSKLTSWCHKHDRDTVCGMVWESKRGPDQGVWFHFWLFKFRMCWSLSFAVQLKKASRYVSQCKNLIAKSFYLVLLLQRGLLYVYECMPVCLSLFLVPVEARRVHWIPWHWN